jgi:3-oxoadipate enol-lactonase
MVANSPRRLVGGLFALAPFIRCSPFAAGAAAQEAGSLRFDRSGYLRIGADSLFFESVGTGPVVILIHDGLVHREVWDYQVRPFAESFTVVRYDRRAYGNSPFPSEAFSNAEDLNRLFEHLRIDRAALVGMSSGGSLAIDFTLQYPEKVTSLVLVGAVVAGFPCTQHLWNRGGHLPAAMGSIAPEQLLVYMVSDDPYEIYPGNAAAKQRLSTLMEGRRVPEQSPFVRPGPAPPAAQRLGEIRVPTLILVGESDIPDVHAHAGAINLGIRSSTRDVIPKAGHLIPIEQPEVFSAKVLAFLKDHLP